MKWKIWAGIWILISTAVLTPAIASRVWLVFTVVFEFWWVVPLSASIGSLVALAFQVALGDPRRKATSGLRTPAYLISGPSLVALNLVPIFSLGPSPPSWVGFTMIVLLCLSALVYYQTSNHTDAED